jgi:hypothetical protein
MEEIEIKPGIRVRKSDIVFTEDLPDGQTRVSTLNATWDCDFPADAIWMLINKDNNNEQVKRPISQMFGVGQHWAG